MKSFKITVTKTREGTTGNIEYIRDELLSDFDVSFGETVSQMGDIVTPYSYKEVIEYIVSEEERDAKIEEIKSMLSGHISFNIEVEEVEVTVANKIVSDKTESTERSFLEALNSPTDTELLEIMDAYGCDEIEFVEGFGGSVRTAYNRSDVEKRL